MTTSIYYQTHRGYRLGLSFNPDTATLTKLIGLLSSPPATNQYRSQNTLNGRREIAMTDLPTIGRVVVKTYARGGLIYHMNKEHYLRLGKTRCQVELEFMQKATAAGVNVPEPIAFVSCGGLIYKAWLVSRAVVNSQTFAVVCQADTDRAKTLVPAITENIRKLVYGKIYHVDLHPGNILIDGENKPYIIDFDRARFFSGSPARLWKAYQRRWDRAIDKHGLPQFAKSVLTKKQQITKP